MSWEKKRTFEEDDEDLLEDLDLKMTRMKRF
jgi:hypothetical protein